MPVFLHTFQRENTYAKLHENALFEMKNYKHFLWRGHCPLPRPLPHRPGPHPLGASTLVPSMGNCHGCPQILETPLVKLSWKFLTLIIVRDE